MMKILLAAALAGVVKAQSQCSADYLNQINTLCCTDDRGQDMCHGGQPTRCNGNCATMYLVPEHRCSLITIRTMRQSSFAPHAIVASPVLVTWAYI
jgi:hypothetical protein|eukprot:COSAG06_NODE_2094_length_7584_cov_3.135437_3_plen_96_part_00